MKMLTLKVPDDLHERLKDEAQRRGASKSFIVREAVAQYLASSSGERDGQSALDAMGDLIGSIEGPGDLSFNPKHMDGFGK